MRRTPVFIFGSSVSIILIVWSVGFVVDFLDDVKGLIEVRYRYLVPLDQVEPRHSDLDECVIVDVEIEIVDLVSIPRCQEVDLLDGVSSPSDYCVFEHLEDSFFDCLCHGCFYGFELESSPISDARSDSVGNRLRY